jgi:WD40 repeat protein
MSFLTNFFNRSKKDLIKKTAPSALSEKPLPEPARGGTTLRKPEDAAQFKERKVGLELSAQEMVDQKGWEEKRLPVWQTGDEILGLYRVEQIMEGGMGRVYIAHHKNWNIKLAIKSPNEMMLADRNNFARVLREAESWTELGLHPNVAYCYYVRSIEDVPHIFVEYVDGGNLRQWIEEGKCIDYRVRLDLAIQFCHGMEHAHSKGMIHRDIKPENVLITKDGILKITDFGLVRINESLLTVGNDNKPGIIGKENMTAFGTFMGTPGYVAPEQVASAHNVDERADIFSFGVCLYEMFCGNKPYQVTYGRKQEIPDPVELSKDKNFSKNLAEVLKKCIQWDPENRFKYFDEIRVELSNSYKDICEEKSPYAELELIDMEADGLNNQGVSYLDLGKKEDAVKYWQKALQKDPTHLEGTYNLSLIQWRDGVLTDNEVIQRVLSSGNNPTVAKETLHELLAQIHMERFDPEAAQEVLKNYAGKYEKLFQEIKTGKIKCLRTLRLSASTPGHTGDVNCVDLSEDGRVALSGSDDKTLRVWNLGTGQCLKALEVSTSEAVNCVAFVKNGLQAVTGSGDKSLRLWDLKTGQCLRVFDGHTGSVNSVALIKEGLQAVTGSCDKTLRLWDLKSGRCLQTMEGHTEAITSVAVSRDARLAVSGSADATLCLWDLKTGGCLRTMKGHTGSVLSVTVTGDGLYALSGSGDKCLRLWSLETGKSLCTMRGHIRDVLSVHMSADGRLAISGGEDDTIRIWELQKGRCLRTLEGHTNSVKSVFLSTDSRLVLSAGADKSIRLWEILTGKDHEASIQLSRTRDFKENKAEKDFLDQTIAQVESLCSKGDHESAYSMLFEAWKAIGFRKYRKIEAAYQNMRDEGRIKDLVFYSQQSMSRGHTDVVLSVDATDNGRFAVSGGADKIIRLWELETGRCLRTLEGHTASVRAVSISPEGRFAVSGGDDETIRFWELETGRCIRSIEGHSGSVCALRMSADGCFALSGGGLKLHLWDLKTGQCLHAMEGHTNTIHTVCLTGDGKIALSGSDTIRLWDLRTGQCIHAMEEDTGSSVSVSMTADGRFCVWADYGGRIQFWDLEKKQCLRSMKSRIRGLSTVCMTDDGRFAVSGGLDEKLELWDLKSGQCIRTLEGHTNPVNSVFVNSNASFALSGSFDRSIRYWRFVWDLVFGSM